MTSECVTLVCDSVSECVTLVCDSVSERVTLVCDSVSERVTLVCDSVSERVTLVCDSVSERVTLVCDSVSERVTLVCDSISECATVSVIEHVTFCVGQCQRVCDSVTGITACHVHVASYTCYSLHVCMCKTKLSVYITIYYMYSRCGDTETRQ